MMKTAWLTLCFLGLGPALLAEGDCRYGENQDILICADGVLYRGPDRVFHKEGEIVNGVPFRRPGSETEAKTPATLVSAPISAPPAEHAPSVSAPEAPPKARAVSMDKIPDPYFRFGNCSATGADVTVPEIAKLPPPKVGGEWCTTVTSSQCVQEGRGQAEYCKSKNGQVYRTSLKTNLPGGEVEAIAITPRQENYPGGKASGLAVLLVPCSSGVNVYHVAPAGSPLDVTLYLPHSKGPGSSPQKFRRAQNNATPVDGTLRFPDSSGGMPAPEDAGAPAFIIEKGIWKIAGVLSGTEKEGAHRGMLLSAGLSLSGGEEAKADLAKDMRTLMAGLTCEDKQERKAPNWLTSFLKRSKPKTPPAEPEKKAPPEMDVAGLLSKMAVGEEAQFGMMHVTRDSEKAYRLCDDTTQSCFPNMSLDEAAATLAPPDSSHTVPAPVVDTHAVADAKKGQPPKPEKQPEPKIADKPAAKTAPVRSASLFNTQVAAAAPPKRSGNPSATLSEIHNGQQYVQALAQDKNRYIVMTYGSDTTCPYCRHLHGTTRPGENTSVSSQDTLPALSREFAGRVSFFSMDVGDPTLNSYLQQMRVGMGIPSSFVYYVSDDGTLSAPVHVSGTGLAQSLRSMKLVK